MSDSIGACKDCGGQISKRAEKCPHCGAPAKRKTSGFTWFVAIFVALPVLSLMISGENKTSSTFPDNKPTNGATETDPVEQKAELNRLKAEVECSQAIERSAVRKHEWTDGILHPKFSREGQTKDGDLILQGDRFMAQNGFGAMTNQVYTCIVDPSTQAVVKLHFEDGKL